MAKLKSEQTAIRDGYHNRKLYGHIASNRKGDVSTFQECHVTGTLEEYVLERSSLYDINFYNHICPERLTLEHFIDECKEYNMPYRTSRIPGRILETGIYIQAYYDGYYGTGNVVIITDHDDNQSYIIYYGYNIDIKRISTAGI